MIQIASRIFFVILLQSALSLQTSDPLNKKVEEVIALRGKDYKKLTDASGHHMLQYKRAVENDPRFGNYTVAEFFYFNKDTCFKEVAFLPTGMELHFVDSFNLHFQPTIFHSWMRRDSSVISVSLRDGFLDVTSYTAVYAKNPF